MQDMWEINVVNGKQSQCMSFQVQVWAEDHVGMTWFVWCDGVHVGAIEGVKITQNWAGVGQKMSWGIMGYNSIHPLMIFSQGPNVCHDRPIVQWNLKHIYAV